MFDNDIMMKVEKKLFGKLSNGREIYAFDFNTKKGLKAQVITYGGTITRLEVPGKDGKIEDIVLGFDNLEQYVGDHPYFGAIIGRYGNRIGGAKFEIDGTVYNLTKNENNNILHGGSEKPFDKVVWEANEFQNDKEVGVVLKHTSNDKEDGFPGNLKVEVTYIFTDNNEFKITYKAETDKTTHINLTQHNYYNFTGCEKNIFEHQIMIDSDQVTAVNAELIPNGKLLDVKSTGLDLNAFKEIGKQILLLDSKGFDHNYIVKKINKGMNFVARVYEPESGRVMEVYTTEPGVQFYSGSYIGKMKGKSNTEYDDFYGFCLETQHYANSPNIPEFPSTLLRPGEIYQSETVYKFLVKE